MATTATPPRSRRPGLHLGDGGSVVLWGATRAWLAALGLAALVVGGHDLLVSTEIGVRVWGTLVFGAGAVLIAGAAAMHHPTPQRRALAMVATLLGIALGAMTFLVQVVSDEPDARLVAWGAIMVLSGSAAWIIRATTPDEERGIGVWKQLPVLKSIVSVGVLISVAQFWYTAIYIPTTAAANLTLEPKLTQQIQGDRVVLQGTVTIRNTSGTRVNVLASYLDVMAVDASLAPDDDADFRHQIAQSHDLGAGQPLAERYMMLGAAKSVLHGSPVPDGTYFEPGETITRDFFTWVPKGKYTLVSATVDLTIARRTLAVDSTRPALSSEDGSTVFISRIPESAWLRSLTRGSRYVRVEYFDDKLRNTPDVRITPAPDHQDAEFNDRMWRLYGVSTVNAETYAPIPPAE